MSGGGVDVMLKMSISGGVLLYPGKYVLGRCPGGICNNLLGLYIEKLEKVQRRVTNMIQRYKNLSYEEVVN